MGGGVNLIHIYSIEWFNGISKSDGKEYFTPRFSPLVLHEMEKSLSQATS